MNDNVVIDELTMQNKNDLSMIELMDLKNENYELQKENVHLRKVISDLMGLTKFQI